MLEFRMPGSNSPLAAIFFDLDGTLCAPSVPFSDIFGGVVAPVLASHPDVTRTDLLGRWAEALVRPGPSTTTTAFQWMLATCAITGADGLAAHLAATLNHRWAAAQALTPAARDVLRRLARSWPLGLITNGPSDAQRAVVDALGIASAFRWLLVSGDTGIGRRKPDPAIFAHAASLAGYAPGTLLYVGDSAVNDVAGAAAAGWRTCWLRQGDGNLPSAAPPPELELRRLLDLPAALGNLPSG